MREAAGGGYSFSGGLKLTLEWRACPDRYGYAGSPRAVYLGVILSPEAGIENRGARLSEVLGTSGTLMLFYPAASGPNPYPPAAAAWSGVVFPLPSGNEGTLDFTVPSGIGKRCVFVAGFVPFPALDTCEVSNAEIPAAPQRAAVQAPDGGLKTSDE